MRRPWLLNFISTEVISCHTGLTYYASINQPHADQLHHEDDTEGSDEDQCRHGKGR